MLQELKDFSLQLSRALAFCLCCAAIVPAHVQAQAWPAKPIRMVVSYPTGTSGDVVARIVAQKMAEGLGVQVVVDNRPGANGHIGNEIGAHAPADGYTVLMGSDIQFAVSPVLYAKLPFDAVRDYTPITLVAVVELVIAAHPSLGVTHLAEFVRLAREHPKTYYYGSTGNGSTHQLFMELLKGEGGFDIVHVPYKGSSQAMPDLLAGQVQVMLMGVPQVLNNLRSGRLTALAVGSTRRLAVLPDVPTIAESGFPGFEANNIWGLWGPTGLAPEITERIWREVARILDTPDVREKFAVSGMTGQASGPEVLARRMAADRAKWTRVVAERGIHID